MVSPSTDRRFGLASNVAMKAPVICATTGNITLNGLQTIDGIIVVQDNRVLVKNQTNGVDNGIYLADSGNWTRDADFDGSYDILQGSSVHVVSGTVNAKTWWEVSTTNPVIGSSSLSFIYSLPSDSATVGFLQAGTGSVATTAQAKLRERVSVIDFGADPTGVADSATAINRAITYLATTGGIIYFPQGIYKVASTITLAGVFNITFQGSGGSYQGATIGTVINFTGTGKLWSIGTSLGLTWDGIGFKGAQAAVTCFYVQETGVSPTQMRWFKYSNMNIVGFDYGIVLGDSTAAGKTTYLYGHQLDRILFNDCKYPIQIDCQSFDALEITNVWMNDPNNRLIKGIDIFLNVNGSGTIDNLFMDINDNATYGIYNNGPFDFCIRNSRIEASGANPTYIGYWERSADSAIGTILENFSINSTQVGATAMTLQNGRGATIIGGKYWGNISIGAGTLVTAIVPTFTGAFGFTGTTTNLTLVGVSGGSTIAGNNVSLGSLTSGSAGGNIGSLLLKGSTSGTATLTTDATVSQVTLDKTLNVTGGILTSTASAIGGAVNSAVGFLVTGTIASAGGVGQYGIGNTLTGTSAATSLIYGFYDGSTTAATAFTCNLHVRYFAASVAKGAGSTITTQIGFLCADQTQGTNNRGFDSQVTAGANKFAFYNSGNGDCNFGSGTTTIGLVKATTSIGYTNILSSSISPTVASGFGTTPTISANGTATFRVNVGTGGTATNGVLTMPTAANGWNATIEVFNPSATNCLQKTFLTASATNSITLTNLLLSTGAASAWPASTVLIITATSY